MLIGEPETCIAGLAFVLLLISLLGQRFTTQIAWAADTHGWFKRTLGVLFLLVGLSIATGFDKVIETKILDSGFNTVQFENKLLESALE